MHIALSFNCLVGIDYNLSLPRLSGPKAN